MNVIQTAKALSDAGIVVHPLNGKYPLLEGWSKRSVATDAEIAKWTREHPQFNLGIVLGPASNLICIDIDPRNGGLTWYEEHEEFFMDGVHELSGREDGGRHIYYYSDYEINWCKRTLAKGVDFLARGSQVVTAPSIHPDTGKPYLFEGPSLADLKDCLPRIEDNLGLMNICKIAIRPDRKPREAVTYKDELSEYDRQKLLKLMNRLDPSRGRHHQIGSWILNAMAMGMDPAEVEDRAQNWLYEMGRHPDDQPDEVSNWIKTAEDKMESNDLWVDGSLNTTDMLDPVAKGSVDNHMPRGISAGEAMRQESIEVAKRHKSSTSSVSLFLSQQVTLGKQATDCDRFYSGGRAYTTQELEVIGGPTQLMVGNRIDHSIVRSLHTNDKGEIRSDTAFNISTLLQSQEGVRGTVRYDSFANKFMVMGQPKWMTKGRVGSEGVPFTDGHEAVLKMYLEEILGGRPITEKAFREALHAQIHMASYDPLLDYVKSLKWDGVPRVDNLCKEYLKCKGDSDEYLKLVSRIWLFSAIGRAIEPGCKVDTVPVLTSSQQGVGKSTAVAILGGQFFGELVGDLKNKDTWMALQGSWVLEISELDSLGRADEASVKAFVTRQTDTYRVPFGKHVEDKPRRCIFVGTSNVNKPLTDTTGNRRFLMLTVGDMVDRESLIRDRDQLYAEAYHRVSNGETWIPNLHETKLCAQAQARRLKVDHISPLVLTKAKELIKLHGHFTMEQVVMPVFKVTTLADVKLPDINRLRRTLEGVGFFESNGLWKLGPLDFSMRAMAMAIGVDLEGDTDVEEAGNSPVHVAPSQDLVK